jgi:hypothetical protein
MVANCFTAKLRHELHELARIKINFRPTIGENR